MIKPSVIVTIDKWDYKGWLLLSNNVHGALSGNANFLTPTPSLATLQTQVDDVTAALEIWGAKGNRGSHQSLLNLRSKTKTLSLTIRAMAHYVQSTAQIAAGSNYELMAALIAKSGFSRKRAKSAQGFFQKVENFRVVISKQLFPNQVLLRWRRPLNVTTKSNVKGYKVYKGAQPPVFSTAILYATVTKGSFVDTNSSGGVQTWNYWIVPFNAAGDGAPSEPITVSVISH